MLKPILLVEDDKRDLELTLVALELSQLANDVVVMRDGAQALEYLLREGEHAGREEGNPVVMLTSSQQETDVVRSYELGVNAYVVKPVAFDRFVSAIADLGVFWAVLNEPPPGSLKAVRKND